MDGEYVLTGDGSVTMSADTARRLLGSGSGDAALLYLHLLLSGGRYEPGAAARAIHRSEEQVDAAFQILRRLGLAESRSSRPVPQSAGELPQYTPQDIEREIQSGQTFPQLVDDVQKTLGTRLSAEGLMILFGIYDSLRLPPDVILELVTHCCGEFERRYGPGRRPSMRYIEKAAFTWEREGIFSLDASADYIRRQEELRGSESAMARVLGITGRSLSATEKKYMDFWASLGFGEEAVAMAYDRTVTNTGRLAWRYMDSILRSWHAKNLHTPEEIAAGDAPVKFAKPQKQPKPASQGPVGQVTAGELAEMRATLKKIKGENP